MLEVHGRVAGGAEMEHRTGGAVEHQPVDHRCRSAALGTVRDLVGVRGRDLHTLMVVTRVNRGHRHRLPNSENENA